MEVYQEKLLQLAGFRPDMDGFGYWSRTGFNRFHIESQNCFNSLDWLAEYIIPSFLKHFGVFGVVYYYWDGPVTCQLRTKDEAVIIAATCAKQVDSLNACIKGLVLAKAALEELVKE